MYSDPSLLGGDGQENSVERTYNNLAKAIGEGDQQHIPYRPIRKGNSDPRWLKGLSTRLG